MKKNTAINENQSYNSLPKNPGQIPDAAGIPASEFPSPLIYKLSEFYRQRPDYPTGIVDIVVLSRILHAELDKFLRRPHKKVTKIYFDRDGADDTFLV